MGLFFLWQQVHITGTSTGDKCKTGSVGGFDLKINDFYGPYVGTPPERRYHRIQKHLVSLSCNEEEIQKSEFEILNETEPEAGTCEKKSDSLKNIDGVAQLPQDVQNADYISKELDLKPRITISDDMKSLSEKTNDSSRTAASSKMGFYEDFETVLQKVSHETLLHVSVPGGERYIEEPRAHSCHAATCGELDLMSRSCEVSGVSLEMELRGQVCYNRWYWTVLFLEKRSISKFK